MGPEEYSDEDTEGMLDDLQLLPPDKEREPDKEIIKTHLETLLLLTTERESRDRLRAIKVYPVIRELHSHVEDEGVREACDRLVQVLMRDEEGEESANGVPKVEEINEDEDEQIVDIIWIRKSLSKSTIYGLFEPLRNGIWVTVVVSSSHAIFLPLR